jgi:adenylyltransferase/sulfurtransferase
MLAAEEVKAGRKSLEQTPIAEIPKDREVIVYCRSGARSTDVIHTLRDLGYDPHKLVNMAGGIIGWARNVDRSMPVY